MDDSPRLLGSLETASAMSKPLSAHKHVPREPYSRAQISEFGGYYQVPVPAAPDAINNQTSRYQPDPSSVARQTFNPCKAAAGHARMNTREYGTGEPYKFREQVGGIMPGYAGHRPGSRCTHRRPAASETRRARASCQRRPVQAAKDLSNFSRPPCQPAPY